MIVVGIDPSLSCTAVCVGGESPLADLNDVTMSDYSSAATARDVHSRIRRFEDLVARIVAPLEALGTIEVVCIEGYAHGSQNAHTHALAEFGGILRFHLVEFSKAIYEVAPSTLKKFACGSGSPGKVGLAIGLSKEHPGVNFGGNDNHWDSFALYRMGLVLANMAEPKTRPQREAIYKVLGVEPKDRKTPEDRIAELFRDPPPF